MSMLMLSGCGASVTSKTNFNSEGGGTRSISAVISASDAKNLPNGFEELDILLKQAAPDGITISRTNLENGDAKYQFSIQFGNIEEYNQKISSITGRSHNATWQTNENAFQSNVEFSEEDCSYELISWAVDAFKNSKYSAFASYFTLYEVTRNEMYFEDQLVYSGTGNPSFYVETSPKLIKASIYSDFSFEKQSKRIELLFENGSLDRIDLEAARTILEGYSMKVSIDTANSKITYDLNRQEEILDFLKSADLRNKDTSLSYEFVDNPFQKKYVLKENYFLTEFLDTFSMTDSNVYVYVKLPEVNEDTKFTQAGQAVEVPGQYQYGTYISKDYGYAMESSSNHMVDLKNIEITYDISSDLSCKRSIEVSYLKNNCNITREQLEQYFPHISDKITFFDEGDIIRLVFVSFQTMDQDLNQSYGFEKLSRQNLKYVRYGFHDNRDLSNYLPVLTGYQWNMDQIHYDYQVNIEKAAGLYEGKVGQQEYIDSKEALSELQNNDIYIIKGTDTADHNLTVELCFKQTYQLYYFWIIAIIFLIVVAVLGITLYYTKKKSSKIEDHMNSK